MSSFGSVLSGIGMATGEKGSYSLTDLTKSQPIQSGLDKLISDYGSQQAKDSTTLSQYIRDYLSGNPTARKNTAEESSAVNRYYNGDVERQLAAMRGHQATLGQEAVNRAIAEHRGNINRAVMGGGGAGDSSYLNRIGTGMAADYNLKNQMDLLNQERGDYNAVNQAQLGLAGRRTQLADAYLGRQLVPMQMGQQNMGWDIGTLASLQNIMNANHMYGAQYNPSMADAGAAIASGVGGTIMKGAGMMGGMGGGGGGGAPTLPKGTDVGFGVGNNGMSAPQMQNWMGSPMFTPGISGSNVGLSGINTSRWGF